MVKRASKASSSNARSKTAKKQNDSTLSTMQKDAIVMAMAMANAPPVAAASAQDARSPPNAASSASQKNNRRDNTPDGENSEDDQQAPNLPPSPMVTPPLRGYSNAKKPLPKGSNPNGVPHVYHDYSQVPDVLGYVRKKTGGVTNPFPEKLHEMLHAVSSDSLASQIVTWCPHGRAFIVRKPKDFTEVIMPKYFKQTKLTSFQRQLNLYGFRRITQGTDAGAYYHELFLRGRPALCQRMVRQKVKGTGHKQPADAKTEPNFYVMPSLDTKDAAAPAHYFGVEGAFLQQQQEQEQQGSPLVTSVFSSGRAEDQPQREQRSSPLMMDDSAVASYRSNIEQEQDQQRESSFARMEPPSPPPYGNDERTEDEVVESYARYATSRTYSQLPPPGSSVLDSPASPGLHGAAHLLQGIASGYAGNLRIPDAPSLGPRAFGRDDRETSAEDDRSSPPQHQGTPVSFLQPRLSPPGSYKHHEQV